jgi:hypothetical protein
LAALAAGPRERARAAAAHVPQGWMAAPRTEEIREAETGRLRVETEAE